MNSIREDDDDDDKKNGAEDAFASLGLPSVSGKPQTSLTMDDLPARNYGSTDGGGPLRPRATFAAPRPPANASGAGSRSRLTFSEGTAKPTAETVRNFDARPWGGGASRRPRRTFRLPADMDKSKSTRTTTMFLANALLRKKSMEEDEEGEEGEVDEDGRPKNFVNPFQNLLDEDEEGGEGADGDPDSDETGPPSEPESSSFFVSLLYGLINLFIVLPVMASYGPIIYHDDFFRPYLAVLMKLTVVSGAVHQISFSTFSSLPFAVGQVQDAGLIFLSAMATDLVRRLKSADVDDESILATLTIGLSVYTAVMGCALILIGKFHLASYCKLLPSSVIGGYLGYIGFFCGQAGLAFMTAQDVGGLSDWPKFFNVEALTKLAPGVAGGCGIYLSIRRTRGHWAVFPSAFALIMLAFYAVLWATGTSVEEATEDGWINESGDAVDWNHTWDFLRPQNVVWSALPSQLPTLLAMTGVVALSSSLDVAAIEAELGRPLDYNHELKTVGLSNVFSGLTGGYTGSYIFSQTLFSMRAGITSRLMGYFLAFLMMWCVVMPVNILAYVPNLLFGSLLIFICLDLTIEWLVDVREEVTRAEYAIVLSTFALLQLLGVVFGTLAGVGVYVVMDKMGYDVGGDEEADSAEK